MFHQRTFFQYNELQKPVDRKHYAIAFDAASTAASDFPEDTSFTWNHTCTGSNLILVVGISWFDNTTISSITYAGNSLTNIRQDDNGTTIHSALYYILDPSTGSNAIVITFSGNTDARGGAISLTGVQQSSQPDANNGANGSDTTQTVDVTTVADNCWVIDCCSSGSGTISFSPGAGQTERWDGADGLGTQGRGTGSHEGPKTPAGAVTMSHTTSIFTVDYAISAASFVPAPPGPSVSPSVSPSRSPSVSPSASVSPSRSPSVSPSVSPSISPSISPSVSPSVSP